MSLVDRRAQLVAAAITVMTRDGVRAATTRAIVAEADTSLSVFHYCFDSKHQLLLAVVTELSERNTRTDASGTMPDLTPRQAIRAALENYLEDLVAHPEVHQLTYEVTQFCLRDPELAPIAVQQYELYAAGIMDRFTHGGFRTSLPSGTAARHLAVMLDGMTLDWLVRRDTESARAVLEAEIAFLESVLVSEDP